MSLPRDNQRSAWLTVAPGQPTAAAVTGPHGGSLTYEPFYGLREKAFSLSSDPRFLFRSPPHAAAFDQLLAGIRRREGLIVLSGEIGTGKTTLCRAVLGSLDRRTFSTFVPDPFVSREDLLKMLLVDFGVMSVDDIKSGRLRDATRAELSYPLYDFLNALVPLQAYAVLLIDEAQNLPVSLLEEIRILADLEGREKLLQVVLIGQPELRDKLKLPEMRQVEQRVVVRCELEPLGRDDVHRYVAWRLDVAAGGTAAVHFTHEAVDLVHHGSGGTPRLINRICDRALVEGHAATARIIDAGLVRRALDALSFAPASADETVAAQASAIAPASAPMPAPVTVHPDDERLLEFASEPELPAPAETRRPVSSATVAMMALLALLIGAAGWPVLRGLAATEAVGLAPLPPRPSLATSAELTAPAPPLPDAGAYVIQVASFDERSRASRLVRQLVAAGYSAYQDEFDDGAGGRMVVVLIGRYRTVEEAQADLDRVRAIRGYADATVRVLAGEPATTP